MKPTAKQLREVAPGARMPGVGGCVYSAGGREVRWHVRRGLIGRCYYGMVNGACVGRGTMKRARAEAEKSAMFYWT